MPNCTCRWKTSIRERPNEKCQRASLETYVEDNLILNRDGEQVCLSGRYRATAIEPNFQ